MRRPLSAAGIPAGRSGPLWRRGDFRSFWTAQSTGILGGQVSQFTLPAAAILLLQADAVAVGVVHALQTLPYLVLGLGVGVLADRTPRRRLIVLAGAGRVVVLAAVPLAALLHLLTMEQLYVAAALNGAMAVVFTVACQAHLPDLVERPRLVEANARLQASRSAVEVAAPALSGAAIQWLGAADALLADAAAHAVSAAAAARLPAPDRRLGSAQRAFLADLRQGVGAVLGHPVLRTVTAASVVLNLGVSMAQTLLLLFAYRDLGLAPGAVGALLALGSLGFAAGVAVTSPLSDRLGPGPALALSCLLIGLALLLTPAAALGAAGPVLAATQFLLSMQWPVYNAIQVTLRQQVTPAELQGRVSATARTAAIGVMPFGAALAGLLGAHVGPAATIGLAGLVAAAGALCLAAGGVARLRRLPSPPD
ncbi:MAG TPA: MFS transporter [Methylomirabilota bacterium]|nr:MFS transporter [Methylomirabilota bacterium]